MESCSVDQTDTLYSPAYLFLSALSCYRNVLIKITPIFLNKYDTQMVSNR